MEGRIMLSTAYFTTLVFRLQCIPPMEHMRVKARGQ